MNKTTYWVNRAANKRGQGEMPVTQKPAEDYVHPSFFAYNRQQRRAVIPSDPVSTKRYPNKKSLTQEAVLKIEELRHLYALARKGLL